MRTAVISVCLVLALILLCLGLYPIALIIILLGGGVILYADFKQKSDIANTKEKIRATLKAHKEGKEVKPFIEINSSPWYILNELPGISEMVAKHAIELKKQNGPYPSIHVFLAVANLKPVFSELIKVVAYVKDEKPPLEANKNE